MKGLLLKDLAIMKTQGRASLIIIAIAIFLMMSGESIPFVTVYAIMIFVMLGITTLSYDAFDNGYAFLFALPISRKTYVLEKYIFSLISVVVGTCFGVIIMILATYLQMQQFPANDDFMFLIGYGVGAVLFLALMLPVELKFGPEKGRIAMFTVFVVVIAIAFVMKKLLADNSFNELFARMSQIDPRIILGTLGVGVVGVMNISYAISCKIMIKKEF